MWLSSMRFAEMFENSSHASSPDTDLPSQGNGAKVGTSQSLPIQIFTGFTQPGHTRLPQMLESCQSLVKSEKVKAAIAQYDSA